MFSLLTMKHSGSDQSVLKQATLQFQYAFWMGHVLDIGFIKLALLFLFRRIFKGESPTPVPQMAHK